MDKTILVALYRFLLAKGLSLADGESFTYEQSLEMVAAAFPGYDPAELLWAMDSTSHRVLMQWVKGA